MRAIPLAPLLVAALAAAAQAGRPTAAHATRPTAAQAKAAATTWISSLGFKADTFDSGGAAKQTALPFYSVAYDDNGAPCAATTAKTESALATALACLHKHADGHGRIRPWSKREALHLWGPLRDHASQLRALAKTATLVIVDDGCLSEETTLILAVSGDGKHAPRVTAALAQDQSCTE